MLHCVALDVVNRRHLPWKLGCNVFPLTSWLLVSQNAEVVQRTKQLDSEELLMENNMMLVVGLAINLKSAL